MELELLVVGGKASRAGMAVILPTIVGRSRESGLTISHPTISRRHCELFEVDGLLMIRDLGSLNGTLIDGRLVRESPLPPDAKFTIGPLTFRAKYQYEGDLSQLPNPVLVEPDTADSSAVAESASQAAAHPKAPAKPVASAEAIDEDEIVDFLTVLGKEPKDEAEQEPTPSLKTRKLGQKPRKTATSEAPAKTPAAEQPAEETPAASPVEQESDAEPRSEPAEEPAISPDDVFEDFLKELE